MYSKMNIFRIDSHFYSLLRDVKKLKASLQLNFILEKKKFFGSLYIKILFVGHFYTASRWYIVSFLG